MIPILNEDGAQEYNGADQPIYLDVRVDEQFNESNEPIYAEAV